MNFNENDLWRDKTELLNLRLFKLPSVKDVLKPEFDTKDQVLFQLGFKDVLKKFKDNLKDISKVYQVGLKEISRVFQECF